ncbi:DUF742 domain-containing protein [Actinomadura vinacea]|uniref:DUF742 domain-containing protein n=1 Tax=Actinomadura vinacea TaxID=115336 RepID=A0ABN3ICK2_9ACTN
MDEPKERWIGRDAGPIVRPYAVTRGRTRPRGLPLDLVTPVAATGRLPDDRTPLSSAQWRVLELCRRPSTPADLASELDLPLRVVEILLDDLREQYLVEELRPAAPAERPDPRILMRVLDELRRL